MVSPDRVREALLSPNEIVREAAAFYFNHCYKTALPGAGAMKTVIESIGRYGITSSLSLLDDNMLLPQNEETIAWIVNELDKEHDLQRIELDNYCFFLTEILCSADPKLLTPEMSQLRCFTQERKKRFLKRLELYELDWVTLWNMIPEVLHGGDENHSPAMDYNLKGLLIEALSRHEDGKQEIIDVIRGNRDVVSVDDKNSLHDFLYAVAEVMQLVEITPQLKERLGKHTFEDEHPPYECLEAAAQLFTDDDWDHYYSLWKKSPDTFYWFVDYLVLKKGRHPFEIALEILDKNRTRRHLDVLGTYLLIHFVKESYPLIWSLLKSRSLPPYIRDPMKFDLGAACHINPSSEFADQEECLSFLEESAWYVQCKTERYFHERLREPSDDPDDSEDFDEDDEDDLENGCPYAGLLKTFLSQHQDELVNNPNVDQNILDKLMKKPTSEKPLEKPAPVVNGRSGKDGDSNKRTSLRHDHSKTGRNDPCPCGSGRKYKKCCMKE